MFEKVIKALEESVITSLEKANIKKAVLEKIGLHEMIDWHSDCNKERLISAEEVLKQIKELVKG